MSAKRTRKPSRARNVQIALKVKAEARNRAAAAALEKRQLKSIDILIRRGRMGTRGR